MIAKFVGKTSMGFVTGKEYNIHTECKLVNKHIGGRFPFCEDKKMCCLCVFDNCNSEHWCPYSSLEAFLQNWRIIRQ